MALALPCVSIGCAVPAAIWHHAGLQYFLVNDGTRYNVWRSNGTAAGTQVIAQMPTSISLALGRADRGVGVILRKEVIQPQVPLRLPCYDLVPITGFIFGACL